MCFSHVESAICVGFVCENDLQVDFERPAEWLSYLLSLAHSLTVCEIVCVACIVFGRFVLTAIPQITSRAPLSPKIMSTSSLSASSDAFVPDMERRNAMNLILLGSAGLTVGGLGLPYIYFFVPPGAGGGAGGVTAKDALGADITKAGWLSTHQPGGKQQI